MAVLESVRASLRAPGLRNRLLFTLGMLLVFRLGAVIPVPGVNPTVIGEILNSNGFLGLIDVISGGAFRTFSIFAMSVTPYINSSIIMQLLTVVIPRLEELSKEGEEGRKKIQEYTRYGTVVLGLIQAFGLSIAISSQGGMLRPGNVMDIVLIIISLTAGTAFLMWLGEQITEKGIGNGISLLIFAGIVSRVPNGVASALNLLRIGELNILQVVLVAAIALVMIAFVVLVTEAVRKIPVQYAKRVVGRRVYGGQSTFLPVKVNQAGVIPVIFATSLLSLPQTLATFWPQSRFAVFIYRWLAFNSPLYLILTFLLTVAFTYFYTAITFNPVEVANNIKKAGGFIPGYRPGQPTAEVLERISSRITLVGGLFLGLIVVIPYVIIAVTGVPNAYLGGTALLIVVGVAIETMRQIEAHLVMRQYQGFMK